MKGVNIMKKVYVQPILAATKFDVEDIITSSTIEKQDNPTVYTLDQSNTTWDTVTDFDFE